MAGFWAAFLSFLAAQNPVRQLHIPALFVLERWLCSIYCAQARGQPVSPSDQLEKEREEEQGGERETERGRRGGVFGQTDNPNRI